MITYTATEIGYYEQYDVISCGASNAASDGEYYYINFQRTINENEIYFEIDDQEYADINIISACKLEKNRLTIELKTDFDGQKSKNIVVSFAELASDNLLPLDKGLIKIFEPFPYLFKNLINSD